MNMHGHYCITYRDCQQKYLCYVLVIIIKVENKDNVVA